VRANTGGVFSSYSTVRSVTTQAAVTPTPTNLTATATGPTSVSLSWDDVIGAGDYFLERSTSSTSGFNQIAIRAESQPNYTDSGTHLSPSTTYYYRVRANTGGVFSSYSTVRSVTTQAAVTPRPRT
jgi:fibronectin type 3 domain-containing protein